MATEFNYVVNVDTSRVLGAAAEVRSQLGMALSSPTGFASPAMAMAGGGGTGIAGGNMADVSGGISQGVGQMVSGFGQGLMPTTFTNPAMAMVPHYGMTQAYSTPGMENLIMQGGLGAASVMRPPGVGAAEFATSIGGAAIQRELDARHDARSAGVSSFMGIAGGLVAGGLADKLVTPIGRSLATSIGTKLGFSGEVAGAMGTVGAFAAGWYAFDWANDYVGGKIQEHYANVEKSFGSMREMGAIIGAGRGLSRSAEAELGIAGVGIAKDVRMDVNAVADIMAGAGAYGIMPGNGTTDPAKFRAQGADFVKAVDDVAASLHVSLDAALQVAKSAMEKGKGIREYALSIAGQDPAMAAYGAMGAGVARGMGLSGAQGSSLMMGAIGGAGGLGMSGEEMTIMGGRVGVGSMIASTQMGAAVSGMGDMQLMAAMSGRGIGGLGDVAGAAMGGMGGIGDMMSFAVHKDQYRRGIGAGGIRTMARQQLQMVGDLYQELDPNVSAGDAQAFAAMNLYGMSGTQARAYVAGSAGGGGGGGGGAAYAARLAASQDMALNEQARSLGLKDPSTAEHAMDLVRSFGGGMLSGTKTGAAIGAGAGWAIGAAGGPIGMIGGAAIGAGIGLGIDAYNVLSASPDGVSPFASPDVKAAAQIRYEAAEYDKKMGSLKAGLGVVDIDPAVAAMIPGANLGGMYLSANAVGGAGARAGANLHGLVLAAGLNPVAAGAGTMRIGGDYYSASAVQKLALGPMIEAQAPLNAEMREAAHQSRIAHYSEENEKAVAGFKSSWETLARGPMFGDNAFSPISAAASASYMKTAQDVRSGAARMIQQTGNKRLMNLFEKSGGIMNPTIRAVLSETVGGGGYALPELNMAGTAGKMLAAAGAANNASIESDEASSFASRYVSGSTLVGETALRAEYGDYVHSLQGKTVERTWTATEKGMSMGGTYREAAPVDPFWMWAPAHMLKHGDAEGFSGQLTQSDLYLQGKARIKAGDLKGGNALIHQAITDIQLSNPSYAGLQVNFDPEREIRQGTGMAGAAASTAVAIGASASSVVDRVLGTNLHGMVAAAAAGPLLHGLMEGSKQSFVKELARETVKKDPLDPRNAKAKRRAAGRENAVGFGQQESALASINRSLKLTEASLRTLNKRVNEVSPDAGAKGGTSVATGTTPAKVSGT